MPDGERQARELSILEDFLAGTFSGVVNTIVGHPFDTVKIRMQTCDVVRATDIADACARDFQILYKESAVDVLKRTIVDEGIFGLYKGVASPLVSIPWVNSIVFVSYEGAKKFMRRLDPKGTANNNGQLSMAQLAMCGGFSGLMACSIVTPMELVRSRLQVQSSIQPEVRSDLEMVKNIYRREGIKGFNKGMFACVLRDVPAYMLQFYVYEGMKRMMTPVGAHVEDLSAYELIFAGGMAGMAGWFITYPIDLAKSKIQVSNEFSYRRHAWIPDGGFIECWKSITRTRGITGLYHGLFPCMLRAFPTLAASFTSYEYAARYFDKRSSVDEEGLKT